MVLERDPRGRREWCEALRGLAGRIAGAPTGPCSRPRVGRRPLAAHGHERGGDGYIAARPRDPPAAEISGDTHADKPWTRVHALDYPEFDLCAR